MVQLSSSLGVGRPHPTAETAAEDARRTRAEHARPVAQEVEAQTGPPGERGRSTRSGARAGEPGGRRTAVLSWRALVSGRRPGERRRLPGIAAVWRPRRAHTGSVTPAAPRQPLPAGPGQESVWDYPRPPALVRSDRLVEVRLSDDGPLLATTRRAWRVLETSHPPTWYVPREDVADGVLGLSDAPSTGCEWKGRATYWDVDEPTSSRGEPGAPGEPGASGDEDGAGAPRRAAAWTYEEPTPRFRVLAGAVAFSPSQVVATVDGERVRPQEGGFYGGWVTDDVVGPFKGGPGTWGW